MPFIVLLLLGELTFTIAVAIFAVIGSVELFTVFETKGAATSTAAVLGIAGSIAYVFLAHYKPLESIGYVTVAIIFCSFMWYMFVLRQVRPTKAASLTILAPLLTGLCLSYLVLLRDFSGETSAASFNGAYVVFYLLALIWVYDIAAWAVGRSFGEHKMAPTISPNKSWEGTAAGTVTTLVLSLVFRQVIQWITGDYWFEWFGMDVALIMALLVVVLGPLGDLTESLIKRDYGIKDMGTLIPGHGGIMDRFDSTLFVAPAVFYYLYYFVW